jgi:hypothetical protein
MAPFIAAGVALLTYFFFRKQHQANGLLEAFKILGTDEHRKARRKVYRLDETYSKTKEPSSFHVPEVEKVRADFDLIGTLIKTGSVDKKNFLRQYGPNAYLCWKRLKVNIDKERELRDFQYYMRDFEWLANEADRYWQWEGVDLSKVRVHDKGLPSTEIAGVR